MIDGHYLNGRDSRAHPARLSRGNDLQWLVWSVDDEPLHVGDAKVSPRLGNTPRVLHLADGAQFETDDNDAIDALLTRSERLAHGGWIHAIERRWRLAAFFLLLVLFGSWLFAGQGAPLLADLVSRQLPEDVLDLSSHAALKQLEQQLHPSRLEPARQAELLARFAPLLAGSNYRVMLFSGGRMGANAFALPDGTIILTDELVALAANDDELVAIIGHEIGHVAHHHALRQLLQSEAVTSLGWALIGDGSALGSALIALPTLLMESHYSREFELQADAHAINLLYLHGIDAKALPRMLQRLGERHPELGGLGGWYASHPSTSERLKAAQALTASGHP